ncbi:MAG: CxxC-x17-CxxC domain-containing protein [Patescibacteria group bacterium]
MYKPHQSNRSGGWKGGNKSFGQSKPWERGSGDRDGARPALFEATCSQCGNACEVPFKPLPGRDVFCRNCFKKDGDAEPRRFESGADRRFPSSDEKRMYSAVCATCKSACEVPSRPTGLKPIYCRACMNGGTGGGEKRTTDQYADQFKNINFKLDAILKALSPKVVVESKAHAVVAEQPVVIKVAAKEAIKKVAKAKVAAKKGKKK